MVETMEKPRNRLRCKKCGDVIESKYRHDFVSCKCNAIFVDGGNDYWRYGGDLEYVERLDNEGNVIEMPLD
jgi:hypothetical protein